MANMQKYTRGQIGGLARHYERGQKEDGSYYDFGNQEIDINLTHLNYNLAPERDGGQLSFINRRTSEVRCHNRADVNVMCSWVITTPKNLADNEHKLFFQEAYSFLNQRYAAGSDKNVISAYVHMDESTPHLHYAFVPVVHDKKKGIDKVSAKIAIDRVDLQKFHQDLEQHMLGVFGREIGILNDATKEGNKSIDELKRGTAQAELSVLQENITDSRNILTDILLDTSAAEINRIEHEKLQTEIKNLRTEKSKIQKDLSSKQTTLKTLTKQIKELKPYIDPRSQGAYRDFEDVLRDEVKDRNRLVGGGKIITDKGWRSLHHWANTGISNASAAESYQATTRVLEKENKALLKKVDEMQPNHEKMELVLKSPYKGELDDAERKARIWSEEQKREQIEVSKRAKEASKTKEQPVHVLSSSKKPKSNEQVL
jgi:hypothetical protein